jgi:preprotein translocase subunit SecG
MNILLFIILVVLFVLLTPGVLVYLPPKSSKLTTAITHGVIFAIIWSLTHKFLSRTTSRLTSMTFLEGATTMTPVADPKIKAQPKK